MLSKGNKTFLKAAFVSILSPVKDSGKGATDSTREESQKVFLNKMFGKKIYTRIKVQHGKEETGTQGGGHT